MARTGPPRGFAPSGAVCGYRLLCRLLISPHSPRRRRRPYHTPVSRPPHAFRSAAVAYLRVFWRARLPPVRNPNRPARSDQISPTPSGFSSFCDSRRRHRSRLPPVRRHARQTCRTARGRVAVSAGLVRLSRSRDERHGRRRGRSRLVRGRLRPVSAPPDVDATRASVGEHARPALLTTLD